MIASASDRVLANTDEGVNRQIRRIIEANVAYFAHHRDEIDRRLHELDEEWDIERCLQTSFAAVSLAGTVFGVVRRRWRILPVLAGGFMLQHALQGWCPPLAIFRRMGYRTAQEIDMERIALKTLRGDFKDIQDSDDPVQVLDALEK